jgi:hypothetical protein
VTSADFEAELRRVSLITRYTGWSAVALENEATLDLQRLYRRYPRDLKQLIKDQKKEG